MHKLRLLAIALIAAATQAPAARAQSNPALALRPCTVPGIDEALRCGTYSVFENRAARKGRTLSLRVVVAPALGAERAPDPVWVLAGGPGQGAAELASAFLAQLAALRQKRDIVLMDQRGTGESNRLDCPGGFGLLETARLPELRACRAVLEARADLRHYTTDVAVDDMDEVRAALGYRQVNLIGGSYGTRAAQAFMRRHPSSVRSAVLRAVLPPRGNILADGTRSAERELERVLADCGADASCNAAFPALRAELDSLGRALAASPARVRLPAAGSAPASELEVTRGLLYQTLYALMLAAPSRQMLPLLVHRAATEGVQSIAPSMGQVRAASYGTVPIGLYLSIVCSEDVPRLAPAEREGLRTAFGGMTAGVDSACAAWPRARNAPEGAAPLHTRTPLLLISGAADPATASGPAEAWARTLPNAFHIVLPATTHTPFFPGCAEALMVRFVESASVAGLDARCARELRWTRFALPRTAG
jgi:pimeloyl-ACP methyl ester carboxylesterase